MKIKVNLEKTKKLLDGVFSFKRYPLIKNGEPVYNDRGQVVFVDNRLGPKAIYAITRIVDVLLPLNNAFGDSLKATDDKYNTLHKLKGQPPEDATDEQKADYQKEMAELHAAHQKEVDEILNTEEEIDLHCFSVHQLNLNDPNNRISAQAIEDCRDLFLDFEELENI